MAFPKVLLPTAGKQFLLFIFKFKSFIWIPQKRLVSHWNKWISSQIKSTCNVTIKVVSKCLLYIRRISLTGQKGHFDLFPIWWKSFSFLLINTKTSKRFLFITFQKATAKRCRCVYFFFNYIGKRVEDEASLVLSPEKLWIISKALEFFCKGFVTSALMSSLLMSLALFVSWKEAVPQKKLKRIKNAKRKISRD